MDIDWNKYMKDHHIKIFTEEELRRKKIKKAICKAKCFYINHREEILKGISHMHASET